VEVLQDLAACQVSQQQQPTRVPLQHLEQVLQAQVRLLLQAQGV
jgi:hypothetical protein